MKRLLSISFSMLLAATGWAATNPPPLTALKSVRQIPEELRGDYLLSLRVNPDKTRDLYTNPPPFVTIFSNRVVSAEGQVRIVEGLIRVRQKGTNVYMVSFKDKSSWLITPNTSPLGLVVLEPKEKDPKQATIFFIERKPRAENETNVPPVMRQEPKTRRSAREGRS
jgi:hypothetical protein